jgi:hypothetical protein
MEIFAEGVSAGSRLGGGHGVLAGDAAEEEEEEEEGWGRLEHF